MSPSKRGARTALAAHTEVSCGTVTSLRHRSRHRVGRLVRTLGHAACAFVASTAITSPAFAERTFALSWRSRATPDTCVTESALRDGVEHKLGRKPFFGAERADVVIEGEETAAGGGALRARVLQRDRRGVLLGARELEAQSCASLLRAAVLVVALMIDPHGDGGRAGEPAAEPPPSKPPPEEERAAARTTPDVTPREPPGSQPDVLRAAQPQHVGRSARALEVALGGGGGTNLGVLPTASATLFAFARLAWGPRWSFHWKAGYSLPQKIVRTDVEARFAAVEQHLRACFAFVRWSSGHLEGCGGFAWGAVVPETTGVRQSNDGVRVIAGPAAGTALQLDRTGSAARLDFGVTLPFKAYAFSYFDAGNVRNELYSTQEVIFSLSLSGLGTISP